MKKRLLTMMLAVVAVILPTNGWAQGTTAGDESAEAYVVTTDTTITFYYDSQRSSRGGLEILPDDILWYQFGNYIWKATFDPSFAGCTNLTSTANWFSGFTHLTTIVGLENLNTSTVTNMSGMFTNCSSLTSLDLSGLNTGNVTNMSHMFEGCEKLENLNVSSFNTSRVTTMNHMFAGCHALPNLDLTNFDTGNVIDMADMFFSMFEIKTLDLSSFNTSRVVCMSAMFDSMLKLQTIYVSSGWTTASIDLSYTAEGHDGSANGRVFNSNEQLVGGAGTVFNSNYADYTYAHIDGGENNPGYFTDKNAASSSTVTAPVFTFEGDNLVMSTETQNASIFYKMEDVPDMSDTEVVESLMNHLTVTADGQQSTYYQQPIELTRNVIVKAIAVIDNETGTIASDTTSLAYNYEAWVNLMVAVERGIELYERAKNNSNVQQESLENLRWALEEGNMIYAQRAEMPYFEAQHFAERINEICAEIEAQMNASSTAEPYAVLSDNNTVLTFYYDDQKRARGGMDVGIYTQETSTQRPWHDTAAEVTKVVIDPSFANYTDLTSTACWFFQFSKLTEIEGIENIKTENVTSFEWMFRECSSLTTLDLSTFNPAHLKTIEAMFYGCSGLTTIDINHFNTSEVTHWWGLFSGCSGLTSLDVSHLDTSSAEHFNSVFEGCSNLTSLDVSHFNTSNVVWMNNLFAGCNKLKELDLRNFNTENVEYIYSMFRSCYVLTTLDLSSFNTAKVTDFDNMFSGCYDLQNIFVSDLWQTTSATRGYDMFQSCNSLVGGAGTKFDANHTDYTYAHIDGGTENPGYFTRSGEAPWVEPTEKVATPTFSWSYDNLTISTTTEDATILYQLSDTDVSGDGIVDDNDYVIYTSPVSITKNVTIKARATKQGMADSEIATLNYPYESWMRLIETCEMGRYVIQQASGNSNVPDDMLREAETRIYMGIEMYNERTEGQQEVDNYTEALRYMISEIERLMNEQTSTFDGRVLTVRGSGSIDQAVAQVGGYDYVNSTITAIVWEADVPYYGETAFTNPNLLFYANEATKDQTIRNLIYNGVAESITLTDQGEGNINFYCPKAFTARYITYQRNFSQQTEIGVSRGWETIALPFTVQRIAHERDMEDGKTNNITPFGTNDDNKHFWLRRMTGNGFQSVQTLEANVPYIISMPNSDSYPAEYNLAGNIYFTAENVEVPATTLVTDEWGEYTMTSTFQRLGAQESIYVLNVGEVRNGYPEGSIFERNYRATRPFEAYTTHRGSSPAPKFFMIGMPGDDGTTGIVTVGIGSPNADTWYDLQGRKLQGKPTQKGVYIQNGKKITIK